MSVSSAAGGFLASCKCSWRAWASNRAGAQAEGERHGYVCRWWVP